MPVRFDRPPPPRKTMRYRPPHAGGTGTRHDDRQVTLLGAGPGDPDLLTLKAVKALAAADVLLLDDLVAPGIVELAPQARVIRVGSAAAAAHAAGIHREADAPLRCAAPTWCA